ncbi:DNA replication protein DnaC, partial [Staphylococcus pseudintermedius]
LKGEQCKYSYALHKYERGYSYEDGRDCEMIETAKAFQFRIVVKSVFIYSTDDYSIKPATINNYKPQNESQKYAKAPTDE